jgi:hypothetical protein
MPQAMAQVAWGLSLPLLTNVVKYAENPLIQQGKYIAI